MSVVIGLKYKDKCWLACDRQVSIGDFRTYLETHHKIFNVPGREGCIMGHVGLLRGINLLETNNTYIDELAYNKNTLDYSYMVNYFPLAVQNLFVEGGLLFSEDDKTMFTLKGDFLVVTPNNELFEVAWDGSVINRCGFAAIGSGKEFALGSLASVNWDEDYDDNDIMEILRNAIYSAYYNMNCGGGVIIMNNKNKGIIEF